MRNKPYIKIILILLVCAIPANLVQARGGLLKLWPWVKVEGEWHFQGEPPVKEWFVGDDYYLIFADCGNWIGGLDGEVCDSGVIRISSSGGFFANYVVHFSGQLVNESTGELVGEGTLELHFVVETASFPPPPDSRGVWWVVNGTGGLARVRGGGEFWGPGTDGVEGTPDLYYKGRLLLVPRR